MKRFILMFAILALASCKTPQVVPLVLRDSVSVTYRPGTVLPLTDSADSTDPAPTFGGAIAVKPRHDGFAPQAQGCLSARPLQIPQMIRVDTIVVERWHTQQVPAPDKPIPRFYKDCTKGFWILLILFLGSFGFRILKAIYLKR